jgi:biopolymer transport protein ExbB
MNMSIYRATFAAISALAMLSLAQLASAQQPTSTVPQQAPALSQPAAVPSQAVAPSVFAPAVPAPAGSDTTAAPADGGGKFPKSTVVALRELSPWSMFLSADILVKAVMVGLAFASLVTWTIFIAKMIELSVIQRKLRGALRNIGDARSLAEAQFALDAKNSVLSGLLAAAMREARLSAGISSDSGIKERAASSFAEIVRAEARRVRLGMGLLATIGATSPFVGLFGTVWGIMNSFIGISKSQTTNLAVVVLPKRCSPPRAAWSPRSRPSSSTIISRASPKATLNWSAAHRERPGDYCRAISIAPMGARIRAQRSRRWALRSRKAVSTTTMISGKPTKSTSRRSSTSSWFS